MTPSLLDDMERLTGTLAGSVPGSTGVARSVHLRDGFELTRVIKGGYQLARQYSNRTAPESDEVDLEGMSAAVAAGITTFDCGDIYIGVEAKIGEFLRRRRALREPENVKILTKFVPDFADLIRVDYEFTRRVIDRSRQNLQLDCLHMVQFHWWDYQTPGWLDVLAHLVRLKEQGKIAQISLTNFSAQRTREVLDAGFPIASTQVQYSLLDRRAAGDLAALCAERGVGILCYGTLCGSFLSDRWLNKAAPERPFREKYSRIVDAIGGWDLLQHVLGTLATIGHEHGVGIAVVAGRYVLDQPVVSSIIVGAHTPEQIAQAGAVLDLELTRTDHKRIAEALSQLRPLDGDVFDLERDLSGVHGSIYQNRRSRHAESAVRSPIPETKPTSAPLATRVKM
jgi:aryl-alcohol dehydrogenase-like predicted oxidoreductase